MSTYTLIYLLFVHWICDFGLQTKWMAENKSSNIKALSTHVLTYTLVFSLLSYLWIGFSLKFLIFIAINCGLHFIIDFFTSKGNKYLKEKNLIHGFWLMIGFDQWLHTSLIVLTIGLLF